MPRRIPLSVAPAPGESFTSWVDRLADRNWTTRNDMWRALGLAGPKDAFVPRYGVTLDGPQIDAIRAATDVDDPLATTLAAYDGVCCDTSTLDDYRSSGLWAQRWWLSAQGTSACPGCLADSDGVWRLAWKVPWMFGCPAHEVFLSEGCPECGQRWHNGRSDARQRYLCTSKPPVRFRPDGTRIRAEAGEICAAHPAAAPVPRITSPDTLALLADISAACGHPGPARDPAFFSELVDLCRLVAHIAAPSLLPGAAEAGVGAAWRAHCEARDAEVARRGPGRAPFRAYRHTPTDPELMAALLHIAWPIAAAGDPSEPIDRLIGAATATPQGRARWGKTRTHWQAPARLAGLFRDAHLRHTYRGHHSFDGKSRFVAEAPAARWEHRIPQLMWPQAQAWLETAAPALAACKPRPARRYTACALMRLADPSTTSWLAAASAIGLPPIYDHTSNSLHRKIAAQGQLDALTEALLALLDSIGGDDGCPDYRQRRAALAGYDRLDAGAWETIVAASGVKPTVQTGRWPGQCATWIWETLTVGDFTLAPAMADELTGATKVQRQIATSAYRRYFCGKHLPALRDALLAHAANVLDRRGLPGPISYTPALAASQGERPDAS